VSKVSASRGVIFGLVGGLVAVIVMTIVMIGMFTMMGLPGDAFFAMIGIAMGGGVPSGLVLHIITGLLIGLIFGAIVSQVGALRVTRIGKGVGLGAVAGIVAFVLLFLPMAMSLMPPAMVALLSTMQPGAPNEAVRQMAQSLMPTFLGGGFILHLIYGGVLGGVAGYGLRSASVAKYSCKICGATFTSEKELMEHAEKDHKAGENVLKCQGCGATFETEKELTEHKKKAHPMPEPK